MTEDQMKLLLARAVQSPHGIEISTNDRDGFKGLFYRVRKQTNLKLQLLTPPNSTSTLWIVPHAASESDVKPG